MRSKDAAPHVRGKRIHALDPTCCTPWCVPFRNCKLDQHVTDDDWKPFFYDFRRQHHVRVRKHPKKTTRLRWLSRFARALSQTHPHNTGGYMHASRHTCEVTVMLFILIINCFENLIISCSFFFRYICVENLYRPFRHSYLVFYREGSLIQR